MRLQPGDVPLARDGRITRLPCSALHPPGFVPPPVTRHRGGLLPHRFTLTPHHRSDAGRSVFCDTFRRLGVTPEPPPVARGGVSCGVRTFLPRPRFQSQERLPRFQKYLIQKAPQPQPGRIPDSPCVFTRSLCYSIQFSGFQVNSRIISKTKTIKNVGMIRVRANPTTSGRRGSCVRRLATWAPTATAIPKAKIDPVTTMPYFGIPGRPRQVIPSQSKKFFVNPPLEVSWFKYSNPATDGVL